LITNEPGNINRDLQANIAAETIRSYIADIEKNAQYYEEKNFDRRIGAVDFMEFHVIEQIEALLQKCAQPAELILLKHRAEKIKAELEEINSSLHQKLRENIRARTYTGTAFKNILKAYVNFDLEDVAQQGQEGYDNLDIFINGLFMPRTMPEQTKDLEPEMVYYQKTPARIIFELVEKAQFAAEDVFFDLGSGLGQAAILVNLLAGITAIGIEFEPAFCEYATDCAEDLNLSGVTFINADARKVNYNEGTVFFMYTPFKGEMLQEVLDKLRRESLLRKIKIMTYGPCTAQVAMESWLNCAGPTDDNIYKPAVFSSY
jgi:hypothetical protein